MNIGIIGLPQSGKSTVFNALSRSGAGSQTSHTGNRYSIGVSKVPDNRVDALQRMFHPQKTTYAEVHYLDFLSHRDQPGKFGGFTGEIRNSLEATDTILFVVRAFDDPSVPHLEGSVNPHRDLDILNLELSYSDLSIIERRLDRLKNEIRIGKASERMTKTHEREILNRTKAGLEAEIAIRDQELSDFEAAFLEPFKFLTAKPLLIIWNISEADSDGVLNIENGIQERLSGHNVELIVLCGALEADLTDMDEEEDQFRVEMGIGESGLVRAIRKSYDLLGMISFFTVGSDEVKAWTVKRDIHAVEAAGRIHSDIERGFIRAETISFDQLIACGGLSEGRKNGTLRSEGKTYMVQDGDIINFLFNV